MSYTHLLLETFALTKFVTVSRKTGAPTKAVENSSPTAIAGEDDRQQGPARLCRQFY